MHMVNREFCIASFNLGNVSAGSDEVSKFMCQQLWDYAITVI